MSKLLIGSLLGYDSVQSPHLPFDYYPSLVSFPNPLEHLALLKSSIHEDKGYLKTSLTPTTQQRWARDQDTSNRAETGGTNPKTSNLQALCQQQDKNHKRKIEDQVQDG